MEISKGGGGFEDLGKIPKKCRIFLDKPSKTLCQLSNLHFKGRCAVKVNFLLPVDILIMVQCRTGSSCVHGFPPARNTKGRHKKNCFFYISQIGGGSRPIQKILIRKYSDFFFTNFDQFSGKPFEATFECAQLRKVKQMQPM